MQLAPVWCLIVGALLMASPAHAFDFADWEKTTAPNGVVTFDCAKFGKCGPGSRITIASAPDGAPVTATEYRELHQAKAEQLEELRGKVTIREPKTRKLRGYDVTEIVRVVRLSDSLIHYAINAIIHRGGKRHQIICSAEKEAMARSNYEAVLNETITHVSG